jgi:hypothetical protein
MRRPAVTLIEVLVSMFIMAIGMLALLVLFPLGAVSMGQALKDDRCASTASMAENVALAMNIRHDANITGLLGFSNPINTSGAVYVDPYGVIQGLPPVGNPLIPTTIIPRVSPTFVTLPPQADRWFCLPDDITFLENGMPDVVNTGGHVERGLRYSYAYLLTRPQPTQDTLVQLTVVVYSGRPNSGPLTLEPSYAATNYIGGIFMPPNPPSPNSVMVSWTPPLQTAPNIKFGSWILDTSPNNTPSFYRVANITEGPMPNTLMLEVLPNIRPGITPPPGSPSIITAITVMENVAEVFDKGLGWVP